MANYFVHLVNSAFIWTGVLTVLVAAGGTWAWRRRLGTRPRRVFFFAVVVSLGLIFYMTLLRQLGQEVCWGCPAEQSVWGDWGLSRLLSGTLSTEVLLNLVLFVPYGLSATLLWKAPFRVTGVAVLLSLLIEVTQGLLGAGASDILDVLANSMGALVGAGLAVFTQLTYDAVIARESDYWRWIRFTVSVVVTVSIALGISTWGASSRQRAGAGQLEETFKGTNLADYQRNRDSAWLPAFDAFWKANHMPYSERRADEAVALERYTWDFYLATRCVTGRWDALGFVTIPGGGDQCSGQLEVG